MIDLIGREYKVDSQVLPFQEACESGDNGQFRLWPAGRNFPHFGLNEKNFVLGYVSFIFILLITLHLERERQRQVHHT